MVTLCAPVRVYSKAVASKGGDPKGTELGVNRGIVGCITWQGTEVVELHELKY